MTVRNDVASDLAAIAHIDVVPTILEVICRTTGMGFSAVARVTDDRWVACAVRDQIAFGLQPGGELPLETTICNEIRQTGCLVVIDHVGEDDDFRDHHTPAKYGFKSYISVPIRRADGRFFGTLCAIDPRPARLKNPETIGMFTLFANLIAMHLDSQDRLASSQDALVDERQRAELRDQFIAVLGHDLRTPLAAIQTGATLLQKMALPERAAHVSSVIGRSAMRMTGLIENVLDFARGRFGGGLPLTRRVDDDLERMLQEVVSEFRTSHPDRQIDTTFALARPINCDRGRIGQLLANLLANALTHGDGEAPVAVAARSDETGFEMFVENGGEPIPDQTVARLFRPFARASDRPDQNGLGLGLYIAAEIARAHDGTLDVSSSPTRTRFTFRMPAVATAATMSASA
jgi:signal transduction histidine kinase